jgi:hypothetical protein
VSWKPRSPTGQRRSVAACALLATPLVLRRSGI